MTFKDFLLICTTAISIYAGIYFTLKIIWEVRDYKAEKRKLEKEQLIDEVIKKYDSTNK